MLSFLHNPRCSKSRQLKEYLESNSIEFKEILYLNNELSSEDLSLILDHFNGDGTKLLRSKEEAWKELNYSRDKIDQLTKQEWIELFSSRPKIIERPTVFDEKAAMVCRPVELIEKFLG
jgi:arsenate reductase